MPSCKARKTAAGTTSKNSSTRKDKYRCNDYGLQVLVFFTVDAEGISECPFKQLGKIVVVELAFA
jgi:hypothetical protein